MFVVSEAVQTVYLGGLFQYMSTFLFGALVFGSTVVLAVGWTAINNPGALRAALVNPAALLMVNLCAVVTFGCFLMSVQLIEPVITYTVSAGTMPIATVILNRAGLGGGEPLRNRFEFAGIALLAISIAFLAGATLLGGIGFVRGGAGIAAIGIALAIFDGVFFTLILILSQRLDTAGVGPVAVLGLRLPLYVLAAALLAAVGVDAREPMPATDIFLYVGIGLLLIAPPLYFLQHAVSMISTYTISALTALGPLFIFALQIVEGRVDYAVPTLIGISIYVCAAMLSATGAVRASTRT